MEQDSNSALAQENLGPALIIVAWVFAGFSLFVLLARGYVRLHITRRFQIEDWLIILTYSLAICDSVFCTISARWGLGRHIQFLSPNQIKLSIKYVYLCEFFSIMSPCFGRISYAVLLLQLVPPTKWPKRFLWSVIWLQFVVDVGTVIVSFSQCQPIYEFWGPNPKEHCWDPKIQTYTGYFQGSVCSVVDLILALFPASMFWKLNMNVSTKISLSILMGLGVFAMVCSIKKTIELRAIDEKGDPTYSMCNLAIWWTLEAYMVLLAASIPTLRPLMKAPSKKSTKSSSNSPSYALQNLRNNTIGSHSSRKRDQSEFTILSDTIPRWESDECLNNSADVERDCAPTPTSDVDGISKTTTVTVMEERRI